MISIKHLSKSFQSNNNLVHALCNINLDIKSGEIFSIIGSSGAGKSTLLRSINLLEKPTSGHVFFNGTDLTTLNHKALNTQRKKIAMIFQHFNLISNKTVFDNIALPLNIDGVHEGLSDKVNKLLALVELTDKANAYPNQLSGGQKQRVAIARALIGEPQLLLCDEATSALDPKTTKEVLTLLKKINKSLKLTIVLITHEMDVVRKLSDRFALMNKGEIIEISSIEDVFQKHPTHHPLIEGLKPTLPDAIRSQLSSKPKVGYYPLCQLMFYGEKSQKPIISQLSQAYSIELNILQATIDNIGKHTFGVLIVQVKGNEEQITLTLNAFKENQLNVEIIGYVN